MHDLSVLDVLDHLLEKKFAGFAKDDIGSVIYKLLGVIKYDDNETHENAISKILSLSPEHPFFGDLAFEAASFYLSTELSDQHIEFVKDICTCVRLNDKYSAKDKESLKCIEDKLKVSVKVKEILISPDNVEYR